ncbi:uncharacterized protein LOC133884119 [Phragmites australis]|uniref:uncharacterized protein LOC133884119 n=1 Tax=Phragmites australis TaxID=29695 RepID=UPI002D796ED4|nr:uncharacterized protein LOC133884119 [Phragmites australis]
MESGEIRMRFGRCPYCRAMFYRNPNEVIYYCSKCRTPIRGKNPEPRNETDHALNRLEILSADTVSVFSDVLNACHKQASVLDGDGDQPLLFSSSTSCSDFNAHSQDVAPASSSSSSPCPNGGFSPARVGHPLNNGVPLSARCDDHRIGSNEQDELRLLSRRTRRPSSSDSSVLRYGVFMSTDSETGEESSTTTNACERWGQQRRRSFLRLQELHMSIGLSWPEQSGVSASPLTDPEFHRELLLALDKLRGLIAAVVPASSSGRAEARRNARLFHRLESHLPRALPPVEQGLHRKASSTGFSWSSSGGHSERQKHHCRPVLGGAPFAVCLGCSELLQTPTIVLPSRRKVARLRCGGCEAVLEVRVAAGFAALAHQTTRTSSAPRASDSGSCNSGLSGAGAQELPPQPLHVALGYSSPSLLLQSRRY